MSKQNLVEIVRWLIFIPGSVSGAWLAWTLVAIIQKFAFSYAGVNPNSLTSNIYIQGLGHVAMGAAFVYIGASIAPRKKRTIGFCLVGFGLIFGGFTLAFALLAGNGWSIFSSICMMIGCGVGFNVTVEEH